MRKTIGGFIIFVLVFAWPALAATGNIEQRVDKLLSKMTLKEKLGQLSQATPGNSGLTGKIKQEIRQGRWGSLLYTGSFEDRQEAQRIAVEQSRLGIPLLFGRDVIHGYRTVFPIPLGESASWDPGLVEQAARVAAREASAMGIRWTFAPMINIARDPRWGRVAETCGEDPYLTGVLGAAMVRGFQGTRLGAADSIAACAKHYVGYGAAVGGRDYNTTWIPEVLLRNVYLPAFHAAQRAGVATMMASFNDLNGVPASGDRHTLRQILRREWGFNGFVVSDWNSIIEMVPHGYAADKKDAAYEAIEAGVDMEMVSTSYYTYLKSLIDEGKVDAGLIDEAVRNILRVKFRLGLFEHPYGDASRQSEILSPAHLAVARKLATESVILLKNENRTLPLAHAIGKVAVIGPLADSPVDQMGAWAPDGKAADVRTPLAAIRAKLGSARVLYAPGLAKSRTTDTSGFAAAVDAAHSADVVLLFLGEEQLLSGEARCRAFLNLPGAQEALVKAVAAAGKPMIAVIMAGRPLTFQKVTNRVGAVLYAFHPGTMGGPALADLIFGDAVPSGKLTITFPRTVGQVPIYYSHMNTGRPPTAADLGISMGMPLDAHDYTSRYLDVDFTPQYPFGYGLSYATFAYGNLRLSAASIPLGGALDVSADITNTGTVKADEVVELYTRDLVASITRPVKELKGFKRITLKPGEKRMVTFHLTTADLAFYNQQSKLVTEPGEFYVWIGSSSAEGLKAAFRITK